MTALSARRATDSSHLGQVHSLKMAASTTIYYGGLVCKNASGLAVPAADTVGFSGAIGTAMETVTSGASGDYYVRVQEGVFEFAATSIADTDMGRVMFVVDDQTFDESSTNRIPAGILIERIGNTSGRLLVSPRTRKSPTHVLSFPLQLAAIANGDVVTNITLGFAGRIIKAFFLVSTPATTAAKATTLNLEINTTDVTGGAVALTSANCTPIGAAVAGSSITAANVFDENDTLSVEASSTTAFVEGQGTLFVVCEVL